MRAGWNTAIEERTRRTDATVRPIVIAAAVEKNTDGSLRAHVRKRQADWNEADSVVGLDILPEGDVRLDDTIVTLVQNTTAHTAYFTDLNRITPFDVAAIEWGGAESNDLELDRLKLWLAPRVSGALNREVVQWKVELRRASTVGGVSDSAGITRTMLITAPLCDAVTVPVTGDSEGLVTFDFTALPERPKPKKWGTEFTDRFDFAALYNRPVTLVFVYALNATGGAAANVGLGYDTAASVGSPNTLSARRLIDRADVDTFPPSHPPFSWQYEDTGAAAGTPRMSVETGTYTSDIIEFIANPFSLGGAPSGDVQLVLQGAVPTGTSIVGEVRNDADSGWVTFTDGQWMIADLALVPSTTRKMRASLNTNAAGNLTPTLRGLGLEAFVEYDWRNIATVTGGNWAIDPVTLRGEIPEVTITAIRDGERDYHDAATDLLANNHIGNIRMRLYWGDDTLVRYQWQHIDDFLIDGSHPRSADISLRCLSVLCLLRDMVPRYEPGENVPPDGDNTVGAWTTDAGGTTNLYQRVDEATFDDTDYIRSEVNPANSQYIGTFGTPVDPVGRRHYLEYRYQKDSTDTMDLTVEFRQGTTVIASTTHTNIPQEPTAGSFSLTDAQVVLITNYTDLRWRVVANRTAGAGSTRVRVTWVRFRTGGKRDELAYLNSTLKDTYDDLLNAQLILDERYVGPGIEDDTTTVTKTLTNPSDRGKPTSKGEVDALAHLAGGGVISSQGRIVFRELYGTRPVRAIFPSFEIQMESAGPGYEERVPEYFVKWNWNESVGRFADEVRTFHAGALLNLGAARLDPPRILDDETSKWISTEALANTVGTRQVTAIGPGLLIWRFTSSYPYPELEPGDLVLVQTDQFVARDPGAGRAIRGVTVAAAVVQSVDVSARRFGVWIRSYADLGIELEVAIRLGLGPIKSAIQWFDVVIDLAGRVFVNAGTVNSQSIKVAASVSAMPTDATVRAASAQALTVTGQLAQFNTGVVALPSQTIYVKAFAYELTGGVGQESTAQQSTIPFPPSAMFDNGLKTSNFTIDWRNGGRQKVQLGASGLSVAFINPQSGMRSTLLWQQDVTGSRTLPTHDTNVAWSNDTPPVLSTTPGAFDLLEYRYDSGPPTRYFGIVVSQNVMLPTPQVQSLTQTSFGTDTQIHDVSMPASVNAGDLLLMLFAADGNPSVTTPSGWTLLRALNLGTANIRVYGKVASGSEGGTTVNVQTSVNETAAAQVYRVTNWFGALAGVEVTDPGSTGTDANPDPPSLTPSWATDRGLWLAVAFTDTAPTVSSYPVPYASGTRTASGGVNPCMVASVRRTLYAAPENPGTYTLSASVDWGALTIGTRPPA